MAAENFDGYAHVDKLMQKALREDNVQEELKEAYVAWAKTYDKVTVNRFLLHSSLNDIITERKAN